MVIMKDNPSKVKRKKNKDIREIEKRIYSYIEFIKGTGVAINDHNYTHFIENDYCKGGTIRKRLEGC